MAELASLQETRSDADAVVANAYRDAAYPSELLTRFHHSGIESTVNSGVLAQMSFTRYEVGLDSDAVGVLEQGGVVARRPVAFLRSANYLG